MGINRDSRHKRRLTGGRMPVHKKKRAYEKARPVSNTKLSDKPRVRPVRVRGGNYKYRALRLKEGNFNWPSEAMAKKTRILDIVYNASNNELVRTKTLVKNCIVQIDAAPFKTWYNTHYGADIGICNSPIIQLRRQSRRSLRRSRKRRSLSTSRPRSVTGRPTASSNKSSKISSASRGYMHASAHAQVSVVVLTATFLKARNLNFTSGRSSRREDHDDHI
jgi:small subunit ribosomal protein S8e